MDTLQLLQTMNTLQLLQTIFTGLTVVIAIIAVIFAYKIGQRQNEINVQVLRLQDFAEVFLMPQQVVWKDTESDKQKFRWNLLVKNASSYPIYMNKYIFNDVEKDVGSTVIPKNSDNWYAISIPENTNKFSIVIEYEDHRGLKYKTGGTGVFQEKSWSIHSTRRVELK